MPRLHMQPIAAVGCCLCSARWWKTPSGHSRTPSTDWASTLSLSGYNRCKRRRHTSSPLSYNLKHSIKLKEMKSASNIHLLLSVFWGSTKPLCRIRTVLIFATSSSLKVILGVLGCLSEWKQQPFSSLLGRAFVIRQLSTRFWGWLSHLLSYQAVELSTESFTCSVTKAQI